MSSSRYDHAVLRTIAAYEANATAYAQYSSDRSGLNLLHSRLAELLPRASLVLDLGCGAGHDAAELARRGLTVYGCDPARGLLVEGLIHPEIAAFVQAESGQLPILGSTLDGIWACASLLHVPRSQVGLALAEAFRVLKVGGVLFTSMSEGEVAGPVASSPSASMPERTYYYYSQPDWAEMVSKAGFEVIDQRVNRLSDRLNPGSTGWIETFARKP
jgi:ubiquinone/menaquinone biosynthesis C-methylase UbiE